MELRFTKNVTNGNEILIETSIWWNCSKHHVLSCENKIFPIIKSPLGDVAADGADVILSEILLSLYVGSSKETSRVMVLNSEEMISDRDWIENVKVNIVMT